MTGQRLTAVQLTRQQRIALRWLEDEGPACEQGLWVERVRPRPTLFNLVKKGLAENLGWNGVGLDDQVGYIFEITDAGRGALYEHHRSQG